MFIGEHFIRHWSTTQATVALSSGEAELYGVVRGAAEALAMKSMAEDIGIRLSITIHTDSSAAKGIVERSGVGRVRHLDVADLWIQDRVRSGELRVKKVAGCDNPPDILTKHIDREALAEHIDKIGLKKVRESHRLATRAPGGVAFSNNTLRKWGQSQSTEISSSYGPGGVM